ncbi:helix-turn-helix domain-containing protein [Bacteroides sp.]
MTTKRLFVPDDVLLPQQGRNKNVRLLQYVNTTTQENFDAFLTHHALVYILSGVKQIKVAQNKFDIHPGELFLIPRGEYVMSEYIAGENGFRSLMLFFSKKTAQEMLEQINRATGGKWLETEKIKKEAVKIIPRNREVERLFASLEAYSQSENPFMCELIRLKFAELIYLLMDTPYQKLIFSFLLDATRSEIPSLSSVLDSHLYSSVTVNELALLSGRSLSSFKREFVREYGEPPRAWIRTKKLARAAFLLETTDRAVEEVAEASGFISNTHFTRLFKSYYELTPTEYRSKRIKS